MRRPLLILEWLAVVLVLAAIFTLNNAQAWKEPMLDGIPYSEMAQWSFTYGGGALYGGACPPMPPAGIWYSGPPPYTAPPPFPKKKFRSRGK